MPLRIYFKIYNIINSFKFFGIQIVKITHFKYEKVEKPHIEIHPNILNIIVTINLDIFFVE
jgi:hypothetical protein